MRWFILALGLVAGMRPAMANDFDYYVLALSWSPSWCAIEGDVKKSEQCSPDKDFGWSLHGLWPQFHRGYPSYCQTIKYPPSRRATNEMMDIMGSSGLAWHQWKKHGSCTDLDGQDYLDLSRLAYNSIVRPSVFRKLDKPVRLPAAVIEEAFIKANPALEPDMITVTCKKEWIQEVRICLSKTLEPVPCGQDVIRDCSLTRAILPPIR
jgi:ribonuclease T2